MRKFQKPLPLVTHIVASGFVAALLAGCSDGRPARVPVSGIVSIDGEPLTSGSIRFAPQAGRVVTGAIDGEGRFSLSTFEPGDGCPPGEYQVTVRSFDPIDDYTVRWNIPKRYLDRDSSELTASIDSPTDSLRFELTWDGKPGPFVERSRE